jgi:hypothetical protein
MGRPKGSKNKIIRRNEVSFSGTDAHILIESLKYGKLSCIVDAEDYSKVGDIRWQAIHRGGIFHVQSTADHNIYIHRVILPGVALVDHRDGDGLNNRKSNLRGSTKAQNAQNSKVKSRKFKGVSAKPNTAGKYVARIKAQGADKHLGCFNSPREAAQAYNNAAILHFGEFARLNHFDEVTDTSYKNTQ